MLKKISFYVYKYVNCGRRCHKTHEKAKEIIEKMASNDYEVSRDRTHLVVQKRGVLELNSQDTLLAQN